MVIMTHKNFPLFLGASVLALVAGGALAQDAVTLDPISVQGEEDPTGPVAGYAAGASAAGKTDTPLLEQQGSVSVVTGDQFRDQGAQNLSEVLGYSAGVVAETYGNDPRYNSVVVRGYDLQNEQYLNGLRLQRSSRPDYGAPSQDLYGLERVELLRGPASVLYGAGSPAGIIDMVQKRAQFGGDTNQAGLSTDSNGSGAAFGDFNRVVDDRFAYRVTGKVGNQKGEIGQYDNKGGYFGFATKYLATPDTTVEVLGSYQDDAPGSPAGVPNSYVGTYPDRDLRDFYFGEEALEKSDRQTANIGMQVTHDMGNWSLTSNTRYTDFDWSYANVSVGTPTGSSVPRTLLEQEEDVTAFATDLRLSGAVETGAVHHELTFGLDASRFEEHATSAFSTVSALDYSAPVYGVATVDAPYYAADKQATVKQLGVYAMDEVALGPWRASLALRHDWNSAEGANVTNFGTTDLTRDDQATTGRAGLGYVFGNGVSTYLSYATSFAPKADVDVNGDLLDPTEGAQWEAGVKYEPAGFDGFFTAALFDLRETNRNTDVVVGGVTRTEQIGEAHLQGLELEGRANLAEGWNLTAAYSLTHSEILEGDNDGNELANTPEQTASLWLSRDIQTGPLSGVTLGGGVRYIGERYASNANTSALDAVTLLDAGASWEWNGAKVQLNVTNLTDEVYVSAVGYFSTYYGDGRTVSASLTYDW
tara:strand:+ start:1112 stop:3217 length:2106 start_codon:yes stop_codon:yes gene_type:complete